MAVAGALPGLLIFMFLDVRMLKILASILILISTALLMAKVAFKQSSEKEYITGFLSGLLTCSIGMPGPPLMIYFSGAKIEKSVLRSTTLAYFIFICLVSFGFQIFSMSNRFSKEVLVSALWSLPFMLFGIFVGERLFTRVNLQGFYKIIHLV